MGYYKCPDCGAYHKCYPKPLFYPNGEPMYRTEGGSTPLPNRTKWCVSYTDKFGHYHENSFETRELALDFNEKLRSGGIFSGHIEYKDPMSGI